MSTVKKFVVVVIVAWIFLGALGYGLARYQHTQRLLNLNPTKIANLAFWFKADSLALADGSHVSVWNDSSGNGIALTQGVPANQPVLKTNVINGRPTIHFSGNQVLRASGPIIDISKQYTFYVVSRTSAPEEDGVVFSVNEVQGGDIFRYGGGKDFPMLRLRSPLLDVHLSGASGGFNLFTALYEATSAADGTIRLRIDGAKAILSSPGKRLPPDSPLSVGATSLVKLPLQGDIAEIIAYRGIHDDAQIQDIEYYLKRRYGL